MRKISAFTFLTLNGCYKGPNGDISWHRHGGEENEYASDGLQSDSILLFGRVTYEMMAGYWPSPMALQQNPVMAAGMNNAEKIVFSRTLQKAEWNNTRLIKENMVDALRNMKQTPGKDMTLLGSGNILTQLAEHGLIDTYQFMIDPVVIGQGAHIFAGMEKKMDLELIESRTFKSGVVLLNYRPVEQ